MIILVISLSVVLGGFLLSSFVTSFNQSIPDSPAKTSALALATSASDGVVGYTDLTSVFALVGFYIGIAVTSYRIPMNKILLFMFIFFALLAMFFTGAIVNIFTEFTNGTLGTTSALFVKTNWVMNHLGLVLLIAVIEYILISFIVSEMIPR
jgi:hypothetical protein